MSIRVLLVDDQELVRAGFRMVLDAQADMTVVGEAGDGAAALGLLRAVTADVVVMDVRMPRLDGIEATRRICQAGERPRVLMLTTFDLDEYAYAALRAGASGFLSRTHLGRLDLRDPRRRQRRCSRSPPARRAGCSRISRTGFRGLSPLAATIQCLSCSPRGSVR
jgi:chemotaxis response regulator CheB